MEEMKEATFLHTPVTEFFYDPLVLEKFQVNPTEKKQKFENFFIGLESFLP